ncbi:hypothetical protein [Streptomyces sp. NPDC051636]|uniref:hypothetical protein n=1 Tax=Streptomyces sp. NPDC051636 TaxID=3365663 RepID=UPI0037B4B180
MNGCTEMILEPRSRGGMPDDIVLPSPGGPPAPAAHWPAFRDRDGVRWKRTGNGVSRLSGDWSVLGTAPWRSPASPRRPRASCR